MVKIQKGNIQNAVPLEAYNSTYKANGWVIVGENDKDETIQELEQKGITQEKQQLEYVQAKKDKRRRKFDDGLFKGE